eukprot:gene10127-8027_t
MPPSPVSILYRLLLKQANKATSTRFVEPFAGQELSSFNYSVVGKDYQDRVMRSLFPNASQLPESDAVNPTTVKECIRQNFRLPVQGKQSSSERLDEAFKALRTMLEQKYLSRCSSISETEGVVVELVTKYDREAQHFLTEKSMHKFSYRVRVVNERTEPIRVLGRSWTILNDHGRVVMDIPLDQNNRIVGQQPLVHPGGCFEYHSASALDTPTGIQSGSLAFGTYVLQHVVCAYFYKTQNLKRKYGAEWALVTGGSSGIGKSIAVKLAKQGLNVVIVALQDQLLDSTYDELKETFPKLQFRKVAVNLGKDGFLPDLANATDDIKIQLVFNNAGYLLTGFFHCRELDALMQNLHCNAISGVQITHHFTRKMVDNKLKGCVVFTSSAAAAMPSPFSVQYAATKSFVSSFGASLAPEVKPHGIDVLLPPEVIPHGIDALVIHPSPVASRFYDKAHKIDMLDFFKQFAVSPDDLPDTVFASIGRTVWRDIGPTAIIFRIMMKIIDYNFMASAASLFAKQLPDFKRQQAAEAAEAAARKTN